MADIDVMKIIYMSALVILSGCASSKPCYDEARAVSVCRAEKECGKGSFGNIFGTMLSGAGSGLSHQPNASQSSYDQCVQNNLNAQAANLGMGLDRFPSSPKPVYCNSWVNGQQITTSCEQ